MPRTVEHIAAVHELATERRRAGKPVWSNEIDLSGVFHNAEVTFEQRRDAIVARLKASRWYRESDPEIGGSVAEIIRDHLAYAEDTDEFDAWWDELYDHADYDRVWLKTR